MTTAKKIKVAEKDADNRLDVFLSQKLKISRSQVHKMIEADLVLVNDKLPKKAGDTLREKNIITVIPMPKEKSLSKTNETEIPRRVTPRDDICIIAETPDYIVVNKPTGMLTHPTMAGEKNTLADFLVKKYPEIQKVGDSHPSSVSPRAGEKNMRPGIVHRLDKEASGLLVVARTQKMFNHLKEQFKNRTIDKEYFALVHGKVSKDWSEINFPVARSKVNERMAARPMTFVIPTPSTMLGVNSAEESLDEGNERDSSAPLRYAQNDKDEKEAKTEFWVEKRFVNFTLLRIKIHTGRMHQIRVHLFAYNHPLAGDPLYFQKKQKRAWDEKLGRLFLHSTKLSFTDLEEKKQTFESPLPKELDEFLTKLK